MLKQSIAQQILDNRRVGYAITDISLMIIETGGPEGALLLGGDGLIGQSLPQCVPELIGGEAMLSSIVDGELDRFHLPMVNRTVGGVDIYVDIVNLPYLTDGEVSGILHIVEDVSELGQLEQALTQQRNELMLLQEQLSARNVALVAANAELRYLDEAKSRFVSIAAHELRSPLASIVGYSELLEDPGFGALTERQHEFVGVIERSARRLLDTVRNLLDISRIEAGRIELNLCPTDLTTVLETVATEAEPQLQARNQQLRLHVEPDTPYALCDEVRVIQILGNLLGNAVKYSPDDTGIELRVERSDEDGFLKVSVSDHGIGIPEQDQVRLYETFFRAGNVHLTAGSGAGLGLNIVHFLVELHGGEITCESELGVGTTFSFTLPIDDGLVVL